MGLFGSCRLGFSDERPTVSGVLIGRCFQPPQHRSACRLYGSSPLQRGPCGHTPPRLGHAQNATSRHDRRSRSPARSVEATQLWTSPGRRQRGPWETRRPESGFCVGQSETGRGSRHSEGHGRTATRTVPLRRSQRPKKPRGNGPRRSQRNGETLGTERGSRSPLTGSRMASSKPRAWSQLRATTPRRPQFHHQGASLPKVREPRSAARERRRMISTHFACSER
jgi:hypothetical protein